MKENIEKRKFHNVSYQYDVVVVGAGLAGIAAALSAARQGKKTILVTDRPILGGSASSEIRVGPGGAAAAPFNRFSRETGIIEETFNNIYYMSANAGKWRWFYFDQIYFDMVLSQENLDLLLNTSVYEVACKDKVIKSVKALQLRAETIYDIKAKMFIDCTGDGTLGYLAGASYRVGREDKYEFNEVYGPDKADKKTMGATLLFTSTDAGHEVSFKAPSWAVKVEELPSFERISRSINCMPDGSYYGFWWVEYGGELDTIHDDGEIMIHLRKLVNGLWDYIKNSGDYEDVENQEMNWIGYLPGKRESRRLMGPYIVNANDMTGQKTFDDAIGFTGWPIDIHPPKGYLTNEAGCTHDFIKGITDIPFRCLYSVNIHNLLFAGRHISCSHEALGTLRLISTTAIMGQAVGIAASMCIEEQLFPHELYRKKMYDFQEKLLRNDQSIIGKRLHEADDFSRNARVEASSENVAQFLDQDHCKYIKKNYGLIIPIKNPINSILLLMEAEHTEKVTIEVYESDEVIQNYRIKKQVSSHDLMVDQKKWYPIEFTLKNIKGQKIFLVIRRNDRVKLYFSNYRKTGILGIYFNSDDIHYYTPYYTINDNSHIDMTPCFQTKPMLMHYQKENINNGYIRPFSLPNSWMSNKMRVHEPEWIELLFDETKDIKRVELVFNSDLNPRRVKAKINRVNKEMVKTYKVTAITDNGEVLLFEENNNFKRFRIHEFNSIKAKGVKLYIYQTWGSLFAEVFDLRVY